MAGTVTTVLAFVFAFGAGGLFATLFTTFDKSSKNQGLAAANGVFLVAIAFYVQLSVLLLLAGLFVGAVVVGAVTEIQG